MTETLSHPPYQKLNDVLDVFIDAFGGRRRTRGIQTILLLRKASLDRCGISISEVRAVTKAPLENIRRHFQAEVEKGNLLTRIDPDDERVTRYLLPDPDEELAHTCEIAVRLRMIGRPSGTPALEWRKFGRETIDAQIALLQTFVNALDSGLRIRECKMAIVIQQVTLSGEGITVSELARRAGAPLETVRRAIQRYTSSGVLRMIEDPNDDRAFRLFYADPELRTRAINKIAEAVDQVDWNAFNFD